MIEKGMSEPIFVVGMNGSGTSMMLDSLGRHPELYAVPYETLMMPYIIGQAERFGDLRTDDNFRAYWEFAIDQMPVLRRVTGGERPELPSDWRLWPRTVAGIFDGIFGSLAANDNKQRWCEKTPDHVQHIRRLSTIFPQSKFLHMIRDGREVACSLSRRYRRHPELIVYRWKKLIETGQTEASKLGDRYMELRYEDLTQDPRTKMEDVCRFFRLQFSEQVLQSRMPQSPERKRLATGKLGAISANPVKWPTQFDAATVERLERIGGRMLSRLGYRVETTLGDAEPGWWQQKTWRAADFLRVHAELRKTSRKYDTWPKVLRKMLFSAKEYRSKRF